MINSRQSLLSPPRYNYQSRPQPVVSNSVKASQEYSPNRIAVNEQKMRAIQSNRKSSMENTNT